MKGKPAIIALLNDVLAGELVAINQYFLHAKMCENWGYRKLAAHVRAESIDEMKHADQLIDRVLFLEGLPNLQRLDKLNIGQTVVEQFKSDLQLEYVAIERLNAAMAASRSESDHGTEELLLSILKAEEEHADWLETQLELIEKLGEQNYLSEQIRD